MSQFERTENLIGKQAQQKLHDCRVAVFGLGGVGSFTVEALARAGVGKLALVDYDTVDETNINRQLFALHSTVGQRKTDVAKARIADINPQAQVQLFPLHFDQNTCCNFDFSTFDYVVDAMDCVPAKVLLVQCCNAAGTPVISCMGTGNKLDASSFAVADISQTSVCPLARVVRKQLRLAGIEHLKVVYSAEAPQKLQNACQTGEAHAPHTPASISFVPSSAGLLLAGEVVKDLANL